MTKENELMDVEAITPSTDQSGQLDQSHATTLVPDRWLALVRLGWCILVIGTLALFTFSLPRFFAYLQTLCTDTFCGDRQLSPDAIKVLMHLGLSVNVYAIYSMTLTTVAALVWFAVAGVIFHHKSNDWVALLVSLLLVMQGAINVVRVWEQADSFLLVLARGVDILAFFLLLLVFAVFPDGRFVPHWTRTRWLLLGWALVNVANSVDALSQNGFFVLIWYGFIGIFVYAQIFRYRHISHRVQRQQTKWIVFMLVIVLSCEVGGFLLYAFDFFAHRQDVLVPFVILPIEDLAPVLIPLGLSIAILRYRLWDIDILINRTLVYGVLTIVIIGVYALVVSGLGIVLGSVLVLQAHGNFVIALFASGFVVVLFHPLRDSLQRVVNRLMYGERDDPYQAISRLGQRLEATLVPDAVLPAIVETVVHSLKLTYAAIEVKEGEQFRLAAACGVPTKVMLRLPLIYQTEIIGQLLLAPRAQDDSFTPADRRLLDDFARQAGIAAYTVRLTADLQRSRERLVTTREEERRRIRRDLHDGLGPTLASLTLKLDAVRNLMRRDPTTAEALLLTLKAQTQTAVVDIRRLVYELRPPLLDELGLVSALREQAMTHLDSGLAMTFDVPEELPLLPAAIEVAIYRIVQEALTNIARHADAHTCAVHLCLDKGIRLEIRDDGQGIPTDYRMGVGLLSMQERTRELGGTFLIEPVTTGGTQVLVRLPLAKEE